MHCEHESRTEKMNEFGWFEHEEYLLLFIVDIYVPNLYDNCVDIFELLKYVRIFYMKRWTRKQK